MLKKRRQLRVLLSFSSALYSLGFNQAAFLIKTVWKLEDSSRRGCSDTRILFLFKIFFIHISSCPFLQNSKLNIRQSSGSLVYSCVFTLDEVLLRFCAKNLNPFLNYFLFYFKEKDFHMDCCKRKSARMLANACKDHSSPLVQVAQLFNTL